MAILDAIQKRCSVRKYLETPVPDDKLARVMEAARLAPSASNGQEWRFVIVSDQAKREKLADAAQGQMFLAQAPIVIVACAVTDGRVMMCGQPAYTVDVAIALEHIALQAVEEGIGTCWIGAFDAEKARCVVGAPPEVRVVHLMPLGFPMLEAGVKTRKDICEIVMYDEWGNSTPK